MEYSPETRTIVTPLLEIACEVSGPERGSPVFLLHGWPDSVRTWDRVLPTLHESGMRTFVPHLRGCGATRFREAETFRCGQLAALGADLIDLADGLALERFAVIGHDWGARAAYIASCLEPRRVDRCVALSVGYGTNDPEQSLSLRMVQNYWYHWYMALGRGADLVRDDRHAFTRYIWSIWNPVWPISDAEFAATAAAFDNVDWADVVLHSYRVRWGLAPRDPQYAVAEERLREAPTIAVPTLVIHGGADPCNDPATSQGKEHLFKGVYERIVLEGVGHFPQRQAADAVSTALARFLMRSNGASSASSSFEATGS